MVARWLTPALLLSGALSALPAAAADPPAPDPAAMKRAADQFDAGAAAFQKGRYEEAASRFEAAYETVPSAAALRLAIRARDRAEQPARAASLAALALELHSDDAEIAAVSEDVLARHRDKLARLDVRCAEPCLLAVDRRLVAGGEATGRTLYVAPGGVTISASFASGASAAQAVDVAAGEDVAILLEGEPGAPSEGLAGAAPGLSVGSASERARRDDAGGTGRSWHQSPGLFFGALGVTAAVGGVTIWSGVDTLTDPGVEAVRAACAGKGSDCPEYQDGRAKQLRTNILIGGTAAAGLATLLIGVLATDWGGGEQTSGAGVHFAPGPGELGAGIGGRF